MPAAVPSIDAPIVGAIVASTRPVVVSPIVVADVGAEVSVATARMRVGDDEVSTRPMVVSAMVGEDVSVATTRMRVGEAVTCLARFIPPSTRVGDSVAIATGVPVGGTEE